MATVLLVGAGLLALVLLLLAVPVSLDFEAAGVEHARGRIALRWLFGLARWCVIWPRERRTARRRPAPQARQTRQARRSPSGIVALLRDAGLRARLRRLLRDLRRAVRTEALALRLRLGLDDPADTGQLWAVLGPLSVLVRRLPSADVRIEPDFLEPVLEVEASGRIRLVPLRVLAIAAAFLISPALWRAAWSLGRRHA